MIGYREGLSDVKKKWQKKAAYAIATVTIRLNRVNLIKVEKAICGWFLLICLKTAQFR